MPRMPCAPLADAHLSLLQVDARDLSQQHLRIFLPAQNAAHRSGNFCRRQSCGRDLIQQRLEQVMIAAIDHRHLHSSGAQGMRGIQSTETGPDNDDARQRR